MKKSVIYIVLIFLAILCIAYFIRTGNFILGSNRAYYKEIFDYVDSKWVCDDIGAEIKVYDEKTYPEFELMCPTIMNIEINKEKKEYLVIGDYRTRIMMFDIDNVNEVGKMEISDEAMMFIGNTSYRKNLSGEVIKMTIYNITKDEIFNNKYKKLVFKRK